VTAPTPVALRPDFCDGVKSDSPAASESLPSARVDAGRILPHIPPGYSAPSPPRPIAKITENLDVLLEFGVVCHRPWVLPLYQ
jgi:hypothetical protein